MEKLEVDNVQEGEEEDEKIEKTDFFLQDLAIMA